MYYFNKKHKLHSIIIIFIFLIIISYFNKNILNSLNFNGANALKSLNFNKKPFKLIENKRFEELNDNIINIFCTRADKHNIKAYSGTGVFLTNKHENKSIVLTNAHVARHILDRQNKCIGRTGNPTKSTHNLVLRYIPTMWVRNNSKYVTGDIDIDSNGEFDFAFIEANLINNKKNKNIYNSLKANLDFSINKQFDQTDKIISSYPAENILSKNIYSPLFISQDKAKIIGSYNSPTFDEINSLIDISGTKTIDNGSSGGLIVDVSDKYRFVGLISNLIENNQPQTVRALTIDHILNTIIRDIKITNNSQIDGILDLLIKKINENDVSSKIFEVFSNPKLYSVLEDATRNSLIETGILKR